MKFKRHLVFCFFLLVAPAGCEETPDIVEGSGAAETVEDGPVSCETGVNCPDSPTAFDLCERQMDGGGLCVSLSYWDALSAFLTDEDKDKQFAEQSAAEVCYNAGRGDDPTCEQQVEMGTLYGALSIGDCDDTDAAINSSASEKDDGVDNDCDGKTDFADPSCVDCDCGTKDCEDGNPCTANPCGHTTPEGCTTKVVGNGLGCEDGDLCTTGTKCSAGECLGGKPVVCEDDNSCTDNNCNTASGCDFPVFGNGTVCDDGSVCTDESVCTDSVCSGPNTLECDDNNPCTTDSCDPKTGCKHVNNTAACDDGSVCTSGDICGGGTCNGANTTACDDGNDCTNDSCDSVTGCTSVPVENGSWCSDDNACTTGELCQAGVCGGGNPADCDDDNACTDDLCDASAGCVIVANTVPCTDGNACTVGDACAAMACKSGPVANCNDGKVCTADSCDSATGCKHANMASGSGCNDGNACTVGTTCSADVCGGGSPTDCDDDESCTTDSCDAVTGCAHQAQTENDVCSDGKACTTLDVCTAGKCAGTMPADCDDNNPCTTDTCDDAAGCVHSPVLNGTNCDTNSTVCDGSGSCSAGTCVAIAALDCDDEVDFTTDSCHPANGCKHVLDAGRCFENVDCGAGKVCEDEPLYHCSPATCVEDKDCDADPTTVTFDNPVDLPAKYQWGCSVGATAANPGTCTTCRDNELDGECGSPELCPAEGTKKSFDVDNDGVKDGIDLDDDGDGSTDEGPCECVPDVVGAGCPSGQTCQADGDCTATPDSGAACTKDTDCGGTGDQICAKFGAKKGSCIASIMVCWDDDKVCSDGTTDSTCECGGNYFSPPVWNFKSGDPPPECTKKVGTSATQFPVEPECCAGEKDDNGVQFCHGATVHPY